MQTLIEAPFTLDTQTEEEIKGAIDQLERLHSNITKANVYFKTGDGQGENDHSAQIELHVPGPPIFVSADAPSAMIAFRDAIEKVEHALRKAKSIREDQHKARH